MEPHVDEVFVLSARYGLVKLEQPLEPYEQTLKAMVRGREFRYEVAGRALRLDRTNQMLPYTHLERAYQLVPLRSTTNVNHLRVPAYIDAILMDPRIRQSDW